MIVTTILLALVMYFVWGAIFILPLIFLLFFGTLDGAFWGGIKVLDLANDSNITKVSSGGLVSMDGGSYHDLFYVLLAMGYDKKARLRVGTKGSARGTSPTRRRYSCRERCRRGIHSGGPSSPLCTTINSRIL